MSKTLVIAEKPSVGRDLAGALPGTFKQSKDKTHLEGDGYVITWAIGHLVGLAAPEEYDEKLKKWRFADLPIVPQKFKLLPNDDRAKKQLQAVHKLMKDKDVDLIVNACDAGREGELIFAYLFETSGVQKPVKRLWLSSMTKKAIEEAFAHLREGEEMRLLEEAARSRSEADWLVGMNATRAASIRLRAAFDGAVSLGRVQTPTLALVVRRELEIRAFVPEPYWLVEARFAATGERLYSGRYLGGKRIKEDEAAAIVEDTTGQPGTITKLEKKEEKESPQLLYDLTSLQRHGNTLFGFSARRTLAAAQKLYEEHKAITYPRTNSRFLTSDMIGEIKPTAAHVGRNERYAKGAAFVTRMEKLPLGRVVNDKRVEDHHAIIPTRSEHDLSKMGPDESRIYDLDRQALPGHLPSRRGLRAHADRDHRRRARLPDVRPHPRRGGLEGRLRRGSPVGQGRRRLGRRPAPPEARAGRGRRDPVGRLAPQGDAAAAALHRGVAARRDGGRGQGDRGRRAPRGHEGLGHRHARHAGVDHRAAPPGGLHRARGPCPDRHREGRPGHLAARGAPAHVRRS